MLSTYLRPSWGMTPGTGFARGPAAHLTVHIPQSSLEFLSAVFYSACSHLCSKIAEGEFWFLCKCALGHGPRAQGHARTWDEIC